MLVHRHTYTEVNVWGCFAPFIKNVHNFCLQSKKAGISHADISVRSEVNKTPAISTALKTKL